MFHILTIIGARPQIIKAAAISRAIHTHFSTQIRETMVHTGQHYDENMSRVFFEELNIPAEDYNLNIGSGSHGVQTGAMIPQIEAILQREQPDALLLYGDTNSTLAGAIAASKLHIPIIHIEAGVRSGKKNIPEEINRITCDHLSTLLFVPTQSGIEGLRKEGFQLENFEGKASIDQPQAYLCGDIMYDNTLFFRDKALAQTDILQRLELKDKPFVLATVHRDLNTDNPLHLSEIFKGLNRIADTFDVKIVFPMHPRTQKYIAQSESEELQKLVSNPHIQLIPPVSFLEITALESQAELVITDSGGVQKEAYYFEKPCMILMNETAWTEIVATGSARLTGPDAEKIFDTYSDLMDKKAKQTLAFPPIFGNGKAAEFICEKILNCLGENPQS